MTDSVLDDPVVSSNGAGSDFYKAAPTGEIGVSGLTVSGGRAKDEFLRDLSGPRLFKVLREMQDNDPTIGAILFAIDTTLRKTNWKVTPPEGEEENPAAVEIAEFVESCLYDMSAPWDQVVSAILSFLPYGFSFFEIVYKVRGGRTDDPIRDSRFADGRYGWRKWGLRIQESLDRWEYDEKTGSLLGFVQRQQSGRSVTIPMEKGLLFRTTSARGNPEGRSILRNAYRPWWFKKRIEEIEGVGIERDLAGLPVALVPPNYLDDGASAGQKAVVAKIAEIVRDIKRDVQEGIIFPKVVDENGNDLWELKLLSTGGQRQFDTDAIVARYDQRISMTTLADFILLGHEKVGSKSLGVEKIDMFIAALEAYADEVCSVVNTYAIPRLLELNGLDATLSPMLGYEPLEEADLGVLGKFVSDISGAGVPVDDPLIEYLRERAGFPPPDAEPTTE